MSDSNPKNPSNNPNKPSATETENVQPTDVSLVCDDPSRHKKQPPKPTSKRSYQLMLVFGLMAAFVLAMGYQTLFGHSKQEAGDLVVKEGKAITVSCPSFSVMCRCSRPA